MVHNSPNLDTVTIDDNSKRNQSDMISDFIQTYEEKLSKERIKNRFYFGTIAVLMLTIFYIAHISSSKTINTENHYDRVDIVDLRSIVNENDESMIILEFTTTDNRFYHFSFKSPDDDKSITNLANILEYWNNEDYYIILDYDIISINTYSLITDTVKIDKSFRINACGAYIQ